MKRVALALSLIAVACAPKAGSPPPRSTLVVGLDVSGSFRNSGKSVSAKASVTLILPTGDDPIGSHVRLGTVGSGGME